MGEHLMSLTPTEQRQFNDLGYLVREDIYSQAEMQPLTGALTALIDRTCATLQEEGLLGEETFADEPFETRLGALFKANTEAGERINSAIMGHGGGGFKEQAMLDFLRHSPLVSCIESLVGSEIIGSSVYRIRPKAPGYTRGAVPWHQDSGYFLPHCDTNLIVTCWIPLVDATIDNGCLYVLPNSHQNGIVRHYTGGQGGYLEIAEEDLPKPEPIVVEMPAGSVLFMSNLTPHASFENTTDIVRWSIDLRYEHADTPTRPTTSTNTPKTSTPNATLSQWPVIPAKGTSSSKTRDTPNAKSPISRISKRFACVTNAIPPAHPAAVGRLSPNSRPNAHPQSRRDPYAVPVPPPDPVGQKQTPPQDGRAPHRTGLRLSPICQGRSTALVQYLTNFS